MQGYVWGDAVFSPLNGSEPDFEPERWNDDKKIRKTHNCYAYVLDIRNERLKSKPQPGYLAGYTYMTDDDIRSCDKVMERVMADNPSIIPSSFEAPCPNGMRKAFLAVDDGTNPDYHFYRLDKTGTWSHKPGIMRVRKDGSNGRTIVRPDKAKRSSDEHTYNQPCGYFCFDPKNSNVSDQVIGTKHGGKGGLGRQGVRRSKRVGRVIKKKSQP